LDGGEIVIVSLVISGCDSPEVFEFVEEAFDQVAVFVKEVAEHRFDHALRHGTDIVPGTARTFVGSKGWITDHSKSVKSNRPISFSLHTTTLVMWNQISRRLGILFMCM
jgi:hypothetical protein